MKLSGASAKNYLKQPNDTHAGVMLYSMDKAQIDVWQKRLIIGFIGEKGESDMRLSRLSMGDIRSDPSQIADEIKAQGFFPGPRAVLIEEATDSLAKPLESAMADWQAGDARLIITAGWLNARSKLRLLCEKSPNIATIPLYEDPPSRDDIIATLKQNGLDGMEDAAMVSLIALSQDMGVGDFNQLLQKIALYKYQDEVPLSDAEVALCAPSSVDAAIDDVIYRLAEARFGEIAPILQRLFAQGTAPVALCIMASRHFKLLYAMRASDRGAEAALNATKPPIFGPRRTRLLNQLRRWTLPALESVLRLLVQTDLALRSGDPVPDHAVLERAFIRIAMLCPKR